MLDAGPDQTLVRGGSPEAALGEKAVDVAIDLASSQQWPELLNVLRPCGRDAVSGATAGPNVALDLRTLYPQDQRFMACTLLDIGFFSGVYLV